MGWGGGRTRDRYGLPPTAILPRTTRERKEEPSSQNEGHASAPLIRRLSGWLLKPPAHRPADERREIRPCHFELEENDSHFVPGLLAVLTRAGGSWGFFGLLAELS